MKFRYAFTGCACLALVFLTGMMIAESGNAQSSGDRLLSSFIVFPGEDLMRQHGLKIRSISKSSHSGGVDFYSVPAGKRFIVTDVKTEASLATVTLESGATGEVGFKQTCQYQTPINVRFNSSVVFTCGEIIKASVDPGGQYVTISGYLVESYQ